VRKLGSVKELKSRGIGALPVQHGYGPQREQGYLARRREATTELKDEVAGKQQPKQKKRFWRRGLRCVLS
jgi:hypothetical protein